MFPPWITPVLCWNLIQSLTGLTVAFTASDSRLRPFVAALTALLACTLQSNIQTHFAATGPSGPLVAMCWVNVLNAFDLLVLSRASYSAQVAYQRTKAEKKDKTPTQGTTSQSNTLSSKLRFALELPYNYRRIDTPWSNPTGPRSTPPQNPRQREQSKSKSTFLLRSTATLLLAGAIIHLLTLDPSDPHLTRALRKLDTSKNVLLLPFRDAIAHKHDLLVQALFTLSFGLITRAAIVGGHTAAAILAVSLGDSPANWPPIFEPLHEARSLHGLWGKSWHQILRIPLTSNATFLASSILGLHPKSRGAHWLRVTFAFTVSGVIHSLCDIGFGVPLHETGGFHFYTLQIFGFVVESVVGAVYRAVVKQSRALGGGVGVGRAVEKVVGYVWVLAFLAWSTPVWINPILVGLAGDGTKVMSPWLGLSPSVYEL
ncbi:membrane bound O-acyl transferase family-domain-containing protein [Aspergillus heterothallicus]